jgi:hypothetical protein
VRRCRLAVCALLALAAAAFGVLPFPQAARADSDIQIMSVSAPAGSPGLLTVVASSQTPLTKMTVHLSQGANDVLDVSDFGLPGGSGLQTYAVQTKLTSMSTAGQPNFLPAGTYAVTVDASDAQDSVSGVPPLDGQNGTGSFPFLIQPEVMLNPATIDFSHSTVTFTGQVTGVWPGSTAPQPFPGKNVTMAGPAGPVSAATDSHGDFTIPAPAAKPGQSYQATVGADSASTGAASAPVVVTATADPVSLTASLAKGTIKYGQTASVSGTVSYEPAGASKFQPLAGTTVTLARSSPAGQPSISVVTKANGGFTANIPAQRVTGRWTVSAGGTTLLQVAGKNLTLNVQLPTGFRQVTMGLSAFRVLTVKSCLNVTSPGGDKDSVTAPVTLQYASRAKGPWKKLRTIAATRGGGPYCAAGTSSWQASVTAPLASAYYRLSFGGNSGLQAATSAALHRWRYATKITGFSITPRRVAAKGAVTVSGRLWHNTGAWHPYAHRKVGILFFFQGTWYIYQDEPVTNSRGYFSGRFTVYASSPWITQYDGDATNFGSASPRITITVTNTAVLMVPHGGRRDPQRVVSLGLGR